MPIDWGAWKYALGALIGIYGLALFIAAAFFGGDKGIIRYHIFLFRAARTMLGASLMGIGHVLRSAGAGVRGKPKAKKDAKH